MNMSELEVAENIAESLRQEPYHLFRNDCLFKSLRFRSQCRKRGIRAYLVWCALGLTKARLPLLGRLPSRTPHTSGEMLKGKGLKHHALWVAQVAGYCAFKNQTHNYG